MTQEKYDRARELKVEISILESLKNHLSELTTNELEDYLSECLRNIDTLDTSKRLCEALSCEINHIIYEAARRINILNKEFEKI